MKTIETHNQGFLTDEEIARIAESRKEMVNRIGREGLSAQYEALKTLDERDGPWEKKARLEKLTS